MLIFYPFIQFNYQGCLKYRYQVMGTYKIRQVVSRMKVASGFMFAINTNTLLKDLNYMLIPIERVDLLNRVVGL